MSSVEEAKGILSGIRVSCRFACRHCEREQRLLVRLGSSSSTPELLAHFPGGDLRVPLNQSDGNRWEGILVFPWEEFVLLLGDTERTAMVPIYGPCSAALENNAMLDESVPVVSLWQLGEAVARVTTGISIEPHHFHSERNGAKHIAHEAARILLAASNNVGEGQQSKKDV